MQPELPTIVAHAGGGTELPVNLRLFVAALAGFAAAALTAIALDRLEAGDRALDVVIATTMGGEPGEITRLTRRLFLYSSGMVLGLLFQVVVIVSEAVAPVDLSIVGSLTLSDVTAAGVVALVCYVAVAHLVFPRYRRGKTSSTDAGRNALRRTWLVVSTVYGVALLVALPVLYLVVPVS